MMNDNTTINWATILLGEKLLFELLGKILFTELDRDWLQSLIDEDVFAESPFGESQAEVQRGLEYLQAWSRENKSGISKEAFLDVQVDCTKMFYGFGKVLVPMWESVYFSEERMLFQAETLQVRSWYRQFGLESEKLHQEPDDHIGLELAFLAHLAFLGLQALEQNDEAGFQQALEAQRRFFHEHLSAWILRWCFLVEKYARTDFYRGLASLTRGAAYELSEVLSVALPQEAFE